MLRGYMAKDAECGHSTSLHAGMWPGMPGHRDEIISLTGNHPFTFRTFLN